jgi:hypothetical protein
MLEYGISLALVASALDEVAQDRNLIKLSAAANDDERAAFEYLQANLDDCRNEALDRLDAWIHGFRKEAQQLGLTGDMVKQAIFGVDLNPWLDVPLTMAAYMTPVLGTVMTGADAARNFGKMFGGKLNWKQRLGYGGMGLLDTGLTALSLIPGLGVVGASAKAGKLSKALMVFGKPGARLAATLGKGTELSARASKAALGAAARGTSLGGKALRVAGFNPAYKAGRIRNVLRAGARKIPGLRNVSPKQYLNPWERLSQWHKLMESGQGAVQTVPGMKGVVSGLGGAWDSSKLIDNPAWRRMMLGYLPASAGLGMMTGEGLDSEDTGPTMAKQRLPKDVGRMAHYTTPLIRTRRRPVR